MATTELEYVVSQLRKTKVPLDELAKAANVAPRTIRYIKAGKDPLYSTVTKLLEYFSK